MAAVRYRRRWRRPRLMLWRGHDHAQCYRGFQLNGRRRMLIVGRSEDEAKGRGKASMMTRRSSGDNLCQALQSRNSLPTSPTSGRVRQAHTTFTVFPILHRHHCISAESSHEIMEVARKSIAVTATLYRALAEMMLLACCLEPPERCCQMTFKVNILRFISPRVLYA